MSAPLWRWPDLCRAVGIAPVAGPDVTGISIDSRTAGPGDLFIALTGDPGPRFNPSQRSDRDGHDFVDAALERGVAGVLTHDDQARGCPELKVSDTLDALWALGAAGRNRLDCPVIGVTGSSGKTTTKTMLAAVLGAFATPGSLNNHLGVPLSLARTPAQAPAAVFEIGTNHPGEIEPLARLVAPDLAIVLNVHPAHVENFRDLDALRTEKLSISQGLGADGILVVEDQVDTSSLAESIKQVRFGASEIADVQLLACSAVSATYLVAGEEVTARVPGGGDHRALSLGAVLAVLLALGRDLQPGLSLDDNLVPAGRGSRSDVNGITLIDDSYNANPTSMKAALRALAALPGRRFALLGEMLELGEAGPRLHGELVEYCRVLDGVACVGPGLQAMSQTLPGDVGQGYWEKPDSSLVEHLRTTLRPGDTLLVKGSNGVFWKLDFVATLREQL